MPITTLRQAAFEGVKREFHCEADGGAHTVVETSSNTKNASVVLRPAHGGKGLTVLSFDKPRQRGASDPIFPYFNDSIAGLCQKCDAIVVFNEDGKAWVIALELKSTNLGSARAQINAGLCFAKFIASRLSTLVEGGPGQVMIGAVVLAVSPVALKRAQATSLNVRDIDGVRAALVYDKAEIRVSELLEFILNNALAKPL